MAQGGNDVSALIREAIRAGAAKFAEVDQTLSGFSQEMRLALSEEILMAALPVILADDSEAVEQIARTLHQRSLRYGLSHGSDEELRAAAAVGRYVFRPAAISVLSTLRSLLGVEKATEGRND